MHLSLSLTETNGRMEGTLVDGKSTAIWLLDIFELKRMFGLLVAVAVAAGLLAIFVVVAIVSIFSSPFNQKHNKRKL